MLSNLHPSRTAWRVSHIHDCQIQSVVILTHIHMYKNSLESAKSAFCFGKRIWKKTEDGVFKV